MRSSNSSVDISKLVSFSYHLYIIILAIVCMLYSNNRDLNLAESLGKKTATCGAVSTESKVTGYLRVIFTFDMLLLMKMKFYSANEWKQTFYSYLFIKFRIDYSCDCYHIFLNQDHYLRLYPYTAGQIRVLCCSTVIVLRIKYFQNIP